MTEGLGRPATPIDSFTAEEMKAVETKVVGAESQHATNQIAETMAMRSELEQRAVPVHWRELAQCRPPAGQSELFFEPPYRELKEQKEAREAHAKTVCASCRVAKKCLEFAMENNERHGIWGGYTPEERNALRKARR
jgi:WhiB family redox-sensing transcriptional regulator